MPNVRAIGQTLVTFYLDEEFLRALDRARGRKTRSQFIREAVFREIQASGVRIDPNLIFPPDRVRVRTKPIPVRLESDALDRLDIAAERLGTNRSALIKFCAETFVSYFEAHGGVASLPPNWAELLHQLDGRSRS